MDKIGISKDAQLEAIRQKYGFDHKLSANSYQSQLNPSAKKLQAHHSNKTTKNQLTTASTTKYSNSTYYPSPAKIFNTYSRTDQGSIRSQDISAYSNQLLSRRMENLNNFISRFDQNISHKPRRCSTVVQNCQQLNHSKHPPTYQKTAMLSESQKALQNQNLAYHIHDRSIGYRCSALSKELESSRRITDQNLSKIIENKIQKNGQYLNEKGGRNLGQMAFVSGNQKPVEEHKNIFWEDKAQASYSALSKIQSIQQRIKSVLTPQNS